jgi:4'-phosphopantetheinyl transferase
VNCGIRQIVLLCYYRHVICALGRENTVFEVVILNVISELALDEYRSLLSYISFEKQERVKCFRDFQDAHNCLLGDILARIEICRVTGFSNKQLEFATNSFGKPYLTNVSHIYYNISHTGCYVACVIADEPVGIDIELVKSVDMKIAERFFSPNETTYVLSAHNGDIRLQRFFEVWTKKESRIKCEGKGLSQDLPAFSVFTVSQQPAFFYHNVFSNEKVVCYVCSSKSEAPIVRFIDTNMLLQNIYLLNKEEM